MSDYPSDLPVEQQQEQLYEIIGFGTEGLDPSLHDLFYDYYYNDELTLGQRLEIWDELNARLEDEYGIDFDVIWDWEDFRAWYETV